MIALVFKIVPIGGKGRSRGGPFLITWSCCQNGGFHAGRVMGVPTISSHQRAHSLPSTSPSVSRPAGLLEHTEICQRWMKESRNEDGPTFQGRHCPYILDHHPQHSRSYLAVAIAAASVCILFCIKVITNFNRRYSFCNSYLGKQYTLGDTE